MRQALKALPRSIRRQLLIAIPLTGSGLVTTGFLLPWFTQIFTDRYLIAGQTDWLGALLAGMAVTAVVRAGLTWSQRWVLLHAQQVAAQEANVTAMDALLKADFSALAHLPTATPGHILRRQHRAYAMLYGELAQGLTELPTAPVLLAVMIGFDPLLAGVAFMLASVNAVAYAIVDRRRVHIGDALAKASGKLAATVADDLALLATIKASAAETVVEQRWLSAYGDQAAAAQKLALVGQTLAIVPHIVSALAIATLLTVGAARIISGAISVGDLVACQTLLFSINDALQRFIEASRLYPDVAADLRRKWLLFELPQDAAADYAADGHPEPPLAQGAFHAEGLDLAGRPVCLLLPPGGQLAIRADEHGEIDTLCRALAGLESDVKADIRVGEVALHSLSHQDRSAAVALVDGNTVPFDDSLRENVRLWDQRIDDPAIAQALYLAGFEEALGLPGGLDIPLGQRELSGGEMRRVAIAQALIRQPRVIILDGALEALDIALVRRILQRLEQARLITVVVSPRDNVLALCRYQLMLANSAWIAQRQAVSS